MSVPDELLADFDELMKLGETLPIEEIQRRYAEAGFSRWAGLEIYEVVAELPISTELVTGGDGTAVSQIRQALSDAYGEEIFVDADYHRLSLKKWTSESRLRAAWKPFAERKYQDRNLSGDS